MGFAEIRLLSDGLGASSSSPLIQCKICHEEEEESSAAMESPCSCSGSLKFAHRGCIQRWCDEKRSTVCEICLEKFEPGYTIPPKISHLVDVVVTIRASLEVPRLNYDPRASISDTESDEGLGNDHAECSPETRMRASSHCRFVAIMVTIMLLIQHLVIVFTAGPDHYTLALTTVFLIRAGGILLPFLLVMRLISAIQQSQRRQRRWQQIHTSSEETEDSTTPYRDEDEDRRIQHHSIQINS